jgi:hypothetical protein
MITVITPALDAIEPDDFGGEGWVQIVTEDGDKIILAPAAVDAVFAAGIQSRREFVA